MFYLILQVQEPKYLLYSFSNMQFDAVMTIC